MLCTCSKTDFCVFIPFVFSCNHVPFFLFPNSLGFKCVVAVVVFVVVVVVCPASIEVPCKSPVDLKNVQAKPVFCILV